MKFVTITPTSSASSTLETEIMFSVASARAQEIDVEGFWKNGAKNGND